MYKTLFLPSARAWRICSRLPEKLERRRGRPAVSLYYRTTLPSGYVGLDDVAVLGDQGVDVGAGCLAQAVELLLAGDLDGVALHVHLDARARSQWQRL